MKGGYQLGEERPQLEAVHCQPQQDTFQQNGFVNAYGLVDGRKSRIIAYSPGQQLQPHKHDLYESFEIRFGSIFFSTWDDGEEGEPVRRELALGDKIEVRKCAKL